MTRLCVFGVLGLAAVVGAGFGVSPASPVPKDDRKPAAFPAGRYVLGGEKEAARGDDVFELNKPFRLKRDQFILSGGPGPADKLFADDDLEVSQVGGNNAVVVLFLDDDGVRTSENRGKQPATYQGFPIILVLDPAKPLRIRATDCCPTEAVLGPVWVHRWDGARKKLTPGKREESAANLPFVFFDEAFSLADGFEMPKDVTHDAREDLPAKPASLLPRFRTDR